MLQRRPLQPGFSSGLALWRVTTSLIALCRRPRCFFMHAQAPAPLLFSSRRSGQQNHPRIGGKQRESPQPATAPAFSCRLLIVEPEQMQQAAQLLLVNQLFFQQDGAEFLLQTELLPEKRMHLSLV